MSKTINCLVDHKGAPCTCDMSMYENLNKPMSTTTQNDWEGKITMLLLRNFDNNKYQWTSAHAELKELIETILADAREEVIREVETQRDLLEATMKDSERKSGYYLSGLVRLSMAILATLRKEQV